MWHMYHHDGLAACLSSDPGAACDNAIGLFRNRFQSLSDLAAWFTLVPGLIGVLLAAPFILDLEHGTYRLAWTQSVTRNRWLAGKIGVAVAGALLAGGALALLFNWWRTPVAHLDGKLDTGIYDSTGVVIVGYTLFAVGLAVAVGAVWRRSAASLAVAFIGYFVLRVLVDYKLRDHLVSPVTATWKGGLQGPPSFQNSHVMNLVATLHGHRILMGGGFTGGGVKFGAPNLGKATFHAVYQPLSHYWPMQLTETGLFVGLSVLLIGFAVWWTRERVA
jgi:hypothetical protein